MPRLRPLSKDNAPAEARAILVEEQLDRALFAVGRRLWRYDANSGRLSKQIDGPGGTIEDVAASKSGTRIAVVTAGDGQAHVLEPEGGHWRPLSTKGTALRAAVDPAGVEVDHYDKMELVPFGEYVPFGRVLFFVQQVVEAVGALTPGTRAVVFDGPGDSRFGVLICYEGIFPWISRHMARDGADFLVNITNDAWYGPTSAPHQHLAQATFRAIEHRVPLVRAANTGISAVIDPDGRIRWRSALFEPVWHVDEIAWPGVRTLYARVGDAFAWLCAAVSLGALTAGLTRR